MALKHDEHGFLIGDKIIGFDRMGDDLAEIASDVKAIRGLLEKDETARSRASTHTVNAQKTGEKAESLRQSFAHTTPGTVTDVRLKLQANSASLGIESPVTTLQAKHAIVHAANDSQVIEPQSSLGRERSQHNHQEPMLPDADTPTKPTRSKKSTSKANNQQETAEEKPKRAPQSRTKKKELKEPKESSETPVGRTRDSHGRFIGSNSPDPANEPKSTSTLQKLTEALSSAIKEGFSSGDQRINQFDPAIAAIHEAMSPVVKTVEVVGGITKVFQGDKDAKNTRVTHRWLNRIFRAVQKGDAEAAAASQDTNKELKELNEKQRNSGSNAGLFIMLASLIFGLIKSLVGMPIKIAGAVAKGLAAMLAKTALGRLIGSALPSRRGGGVIGSQRTPKPSSVPSTGATTGAAASKDRAEPQKRQGTLSRAGSKAKSILRKLPLIGGLIGAGLLASDVMATESDKSLSTREKGQQIGESAGTLLGGLSGAALGAAIGTAILPGIGTAIGAAAGAFFGGEAGSIVGSKVGEWVSSLQLADLPSVLSGKFSEWTNSLMSTELGQYLKGTWDTAIASFESAWSGMSSWLESTTNAVNEFFKKNFNIDPKAAFEAATTTVNEAAQTVVDKVNAAKETVANAGKQVGEAARSAATQAWEAAKNFVGAGDKPSPVPAVPLVLKSAANIGATAVDAVSKSVTGRKKSTNSNWQDAKGNLVDASNKAGVDAGTVAAIANFESGFRSTAQPIARGKRAHLNKVRQFDGTMAISSAHGYGQFIDDSWAGMLKAHGAKYGLADTASMQRNSKGKFTPESMAIANKYRTDTRIQAAMLAEYTKENVELGKKLGGKDDLANVYALHNLGSGEGSTFLKALASNPNASVNTVLRGGTIRGNSSLYKDGSISVADAYANMSAKMREGSSYAEEARNLQKGITPATQTGGIVGKTKQMVADALPDFVKQTRVKDSDGKTRTLSEMGVNNYSELQAKGGQAFAGGNNDPATLYATAMIQQNLGANFDRMTAQNDSYHNKHSPTSGHTKGNKSDFTVKGISYEEANQRTKALMVQKGLVEGEDFKTINEAANPSKKSTGDHIDFKLTESGKAKMNAMMVAGGVGPLAATASTPVAPRSAVSIAPAPSISTSASVRIPEAPPAPQMPVIPPSDNGKVVVSSPNPLVGQAVSDPHIAHISRGGLGY